MHSPFELPSLRAVTSSPHEQAADLFVSIFAEGSLEAVKRRLSGPAGQDLEAAIARKEPVGDLGRVFVTQAGDPGWRTSRIAVVGAGSGPITADQVRKAVASAAHWARERRCRTVVIDLAALGGDRDALTAAAAEAVVTANFNHGHMRTAEPLPPITDASFLLGSGQQGQLERGLVIGEAINAARLLINEPGNVLPPRELADRAAALGAEPGVHAEILGPEQMEALGMGLLLGVARGSRPNRRACCACPTRRRAAPRVRCWAWWARASPSTPAASRSSRPTTWIA